MNLQPTVTNFSLFFTIYYAYLRVGSNSSISVAIQN